MEYRKFSQGYVLRLDPGEEIVSSLTRLVEEEGVQLASVSALGAANDVTIGIFNTVEKQYYSHRYQGDYEISALVGNGHVVGRPQGGQRHPHRKPCDRRGPRGPSLLRHHQRHPGALPPGLGRAGGTEVQRCRGAQSAGILNLNITL